MNKVIERLLNECTSYDGKTVDQESFAVAIIAECIVAACDIDPDSEDWSTVLANTNKMTQKIQKHFGFETYHEAE